MTDGQRGIAGVVAAATIWGLAPLFFKLLAHIPPFEVTAHRMIWSAVIFCGVIVLRGRLGELRALLRDRRAMGRVALAAVLIGFNWILFIWAVFAERATEASLGYYIYPLLTVVLGVLVDKERLHPLQWGAAGLAALAVVVLTWGLGAAPWIALSLAGTFALYTLVKTRLAQGPVLSVTAETLLLLPFATGFALWLQTRGQSGIATPGEFWMLVASGVITATPLILLSFGARRAPLSTVGLLFYINPTLQVVLAALVFDEPFGPWHALAFGMIWVALALYSGVALRQDRAARRRASSVGTSGALSTSASSEASAKP